jgi:hypothetical protein
MVEQISPLRMKVKFQFIEETIMYAQAVRIPPVHLRGKRIQSSAFAQCAKGCAFPDVQLDCIKYFKLGDPREDTVKYMKTVNGFLVIDVGIKIVGTVIGVLFWPPLVSIGVLVAAVFIMVARRGIATGKSD